MVIATENVPTQWHQSCWFPTLSGESRESLTEEMRSVNVEMGMGTNLHQFCEERAIQVSWLLQVTWSIVLRAYSGESQVVFGYATAGQEVNSGVKRMTNIATCYFELRSDIPLQEILRGAAGSAIYQQQAVDDTHDNSNGLGTEFNTVIIQHRSPRLSGQGNAKSIMGCDGAKVSAHEGFVASESEVGR